MIALVIVLAGLITLLGMKAQGTPVYARKFLFEWLGICMCLVLVGMLIVYYQSYSGTTISTIPPVTNTIYYNSNYTQITVYATTNGVMRGYVGNSMKTLLMAINDSPSVATGAGVVWIPGSHTSTLVVPQGDYYLFNYTQGTFTLQKVRT